MVMQVFCLGKKMSIYDIHVHIFLIHTESFMRAYTHLRCEQPCRLFKVSFLHLLQHSFNMLHLHLGPSSAHLYACASFYASTLFVSTELSMCLRVGSQTWWDHKEVKNTVMGSRCLSSSVLAKLLKSKDKCVLKTHQIQ